MNPAQSRRERHQRARESGESIPVNRHGRLIGYVTWASDGAAVAVNAELKTCGRFSDPGKAEMHLVRNATDRA